MKSKPTTPALGNFHGVFSALITPMNGSGEIDHARLGAFADHRIRHGIDGLIPPGSTGVDMSPEFIARLVAEKVAACGAPACGCTR